eukprot:GCRY01003884.1.p1 GENE.GCRY01003884.1~~GCRY01003884.1.p1  ORF type:complete len:376 (-),score=83.35 GCRY01003884.1:73-1200(-)
MSSNAILKLFEEKDYVTFAAPMVRYSSLPFRLLTKYFHVDVPYTAMLPAESFIQSELARFTEHKTCKSDTPSVIQFASKDPTEFATACELIANHVDGIDLNCGCPQKWVMAEGWGSAMLENPELIRQMITTAKGRVSTPIAVKIRIKDDLRETVEMARQIAASNPAWLTVHGRTPAQRTQPVDLEAVRIIRESVEIPVVENGDLFSRQDAERIVHVTGVRGVMAARGLLRNPALFSQHPDEYPGPASREVVFLWVETCVCLGSPFLTLHRLLLEMLQPPTLSRSDYILLESCRSYAAVFEFLEALYPDEYHSHIKTFMSKKPLPVFSGAKSPLYTSPTPSSPSPAPLSPLLRNDWLDGFDHTQYFEEALRWQLSA